MTLSLSGRQGTMKKVPGVRLSVFIALFSACTLLWSSCALPLAPDTERQAELHYKLGISYLNKHQLQEAYVKFHEALRLNPNDKRCYNYLGYISALYKEYEQAVSYYKRAISIDPEYSEAMNNLGMTYLEIQKWDEAAENFRTALNNPLYVTPERAYANLGYALYRKGDLQAAESTLNAAITKYPDFRYSYYVLGLVYSSGGRIDDAVQMFSRAVDIEPEARWELAQLYLRTGKRLKALEQFQIIAATADSKRGKEALRYIDLLKD